ncbi:MAG: type III toxin-antitoxin system ToxN/AbiQ family toxin, partial [Lachnospiraceae bacterium]|nr:type III toxin-antitoxin system ToxN/AbiQ family toxin [Lachnospiraceae bacterium]
IRLYKVDLNYIKYLNSVDNRVQFHPNKPDSYNQNRPYIGIVLSIKGKQYYAPLEHPRLQHQQLKSNLHIIKINNGKHGIIGLNNMIPVPTSQLISFDISQDPQKKILTAQYLFCKKNYNMINACANQVYQNRLNPNSFEQKVYCNFQKLEVAASLYKAQQQQSQVTAQQNQPSSNHNLSSRSQTQNVTSTTLRVQSKQQSTIESHQITMTEMISQQNYRKLQEEGQKRLKNPPKKNRGIGDE